MIPGNVSHLIATTECVKASDKVITVINIRTAMHNSSALRRVYGLGKTDVLNLGLLMNSVRRHMNAHWLITVGMLLEQIRKKQLRNACHYTRRIMELALVGKVQTIRIQLSMTINTMDNIARVGSPSPIGT